jgi:hypothetical protein
MVKTRCAYYRKLTGERAERIYNLTNEDPMKNIKASSMYPNGVNREGEMLFDMFIFLEDFAPKPVNYAPPIVPKNQITLVS